jgi:hypothetical protein
VNQPLLIEWPMRSGSYQRFGRATIPCWWRPAPSDPQAGLVGRAISDPRCSRRYIFRYAIRSAQPNTCEKPSGGQGELGGNDFIVFNPGGGTIMHELGHPLNLYHGGYENKNCKPNYVGVMNYDLQYGVPSAHGGTILDYSPPRDYERR